MGDYMGEVMLEGGALSSSGPLEPEDELDAFNDETFGGSGLGDTWEENQHEQLAIMTEEERLALKQSSEFFNFGSDGEELGGEMEDALEPPPRHNGASSDHDQLPRRMESLSMSHTAPQLPLTVQTGLPAGSLPGGPPYPGHPTHHILPSGVGGHHPHLSLLPPSHFGGGPPVLQDPAIMSLVPGKMPPPPPQYLPMAPPQYQPTHTPTPDVYQQPPRPGGAFSPPTVPGLKTVAEFEAEILYGPPRSQQTSQHTPAPSAAPVPVQPSGGAPLGHINPALHNLNYPGMRDRSAVPLHHQGGNHAKPHNHQQLPSRSQQPQHPLPPSHPHPPPSHPSHPPPPQSQPPPQQFRQSPQMIQQPPPQQQNLLQKHHQHQQQMQQQQHQMQMQKQQQMQQTRNNNNSSKPSHQEIVEMNRYHEQQQQYCDRIDARKNDNYMIDQRRPDSGFGHHDVRRNDQQQRSGYDQHQQQQLNDRRNDHHQFYERRNERGYDQRPGGGAGGRGFHPQHEQNFSARGGFDQNKFDHRFQDNRYFEQATRRDLMPGHVHTLGILRHSRSRHDREQEGRGGIEDDDCLLGDNEDLSFNPTGDPLLDAKMMAEQEEMARKRKHYANSEDEYAGLMSQRDKQWIINIQLNQLKCDNPYVDDYYFTMYQAKKEMECNGDKAGGQLLLNDSLNEVSGSYTPTQFANSLGKLQVVTVKAPRQIIDVGVVRSAESPVTVPGVHEGSPAPGALVVEHGGRKVGADYKQVLMQIEVLYLALLDLESDQLKLNALPTGAPLREHVVVAESLHLNLIQAGLSKPGWLTDCLGVPKGRSLVLRCLPHLPQHRAAPVCTQLLANLHLLARGEALDARFWRLLSHHISTESCESLEPAVRTLLTLTKKMIMLLLSSSLGSTTLLSLILKAGAKNGPSPSQGLWAQLATLILTYASEGAVLGQTIVKLDLENSSLNRLLNLTEAQRTVWQEIVRSLTS